MSSSFSSVFSSGSSSFSFLVIVNLYVFVSFLSDEVTFTENILVPTFNVFSPTPEISAFESVAEAYTFIVLVSFGTSTEYSNVPGLNPVKSYSFGLIPRFFKVASDEVVLSG